ncbi:MULTISPECIES: type IV pilin protein [unclassified Ketobacter]|uniref:type IV pilin protein n=1 Tax=unclassified Ketobacter TaxID=2639109 RepID=UPI000F2DA070|nr:MULTISPECIES: type IV pilin protein [unclassified Ketobacter]RLT88206.1 MAG: prepilin-type N-terminal cleavage/methylation domain-containing protein [Ketobacter sp. GenoA1]RLT94114.1 MAG: prepilin-type N-terminal cleavage/methylation domain-containing protein [Ketobacter sp.]
MRKFKLSLNGFTLIELLIVVAIVAVLAVFAYPSYSDHVRKSARKAAIGKALEIASRVEQFRTQRLTYPSSDADLAGFDLTEVKYEYEVDDVVTDGEVTGYTITVTPVSGSDQEQDDCGTLTYSNTGGWVSSTGLTEEQCL